MIKSRTLLLVIVAVFTISFLAGCSPAVGAGTAIPDITPLTDEELAFFNGNDFFNGEYMNIRNQFLSSLYSSPEKIDLFELFYCGNGLEANPPTDKEMSAVLAYLGWDLADCALEKNSRANMDEILTRYMGLTLADTDGVGLENMTFLAEHDAFYHFHGDTNYRLSITFTNGERIGNTIELYYEDAFYSDGSKVLTLQEVDGNYFFVSNALLSERYGTNSNGN